MTNYIENPFVLNYGKQPKELIEREEPLFKIEKTFEMENPTYYSYLITGIRGSGKTVALTKIQKEFSKKKDWITIDLTDTNDLMDNLAYNLLHSKAITDKKITSEISFSLAGLGVSIKERNNFESNSVIVEHIISILNKKGKKVLICIDEVSNSENMKNFATKFQLWIRHDLNVFLVMTGIYENINALLNNPVLTFLYRTPRIDLNGLGIASIADSYQRVLNIEYEKARELALITKGYAFAYQVIGYYAFEQHTSNFLEIYQKVDTALLDGAYIKLWNDCNKNEKTVLKALAKKELTNKEISENTNIKVNNIPKYTKTLLIKKIIECDATKKYNIVLPRFVEILNSQFLK